MLMDNLDPMYWIKNVWTNGLIISLYSTYIVGKLDNIYCIPFYIYKVDKQVNTVCVDFFIYLINIV